MTTIDRATALEAHRSGRLAEAEAVYRAILAADPRDADALHLLGLVRQGRGDPAEGERLIRGAIAVKDAGVFHMNLGTLLLGASRPDEAEAAYRHAIAVQPDLADAAGRLGAMLLTAGRPGEADAVLTEALRHARGNAGFLNLLGVARMQAGDDEGSEWALREAVEIAPTTVDAHFNLGLLLLQCGRGEEAEQSLRAAIALDPGRVEATDELGKHLLATRRYDESRAAFEAVLEHRPDHTKARYLLGVLQVEADEFDAGEATMRRLMAEAPNFSRARLAVGAMALARGDFAEGWPLYEARYAADAKAGFLPPPDVLYPRWNGEDLAGKSLLLWPEQGHGDAIQFVRFATELKRRGVARLTLVTFVSLGPLFVGLDGVDRVVTDIREVGPHDYWTFLLSVPLHLGTTLATLPAGVPYLRASQALAERWIRRLPLGGINVGLAWAGERLHDNDENRSIESLSVLEPLWRLPVPNLHFISLQKGRGEDMLRAWAGAGRIVELGSDFRDFADTAAVIDQLDLVICVDTAIAHLAGALGKYCWVMLPAKGADWRWMKNRSDSPWYPGVVRLFRQERAGDWSGVVGEVAAALEAFARGAR